MRTRPSKTRFNFPFARAPVERWRPARIGSKKRFRRRALIFKSRVVLDRAGETPPAPTVHPLHALVRRGHFPVHPCGAVCDPRDEIAAAGVEAFLNSAFCRCSPNTGVMQSSSESFP